MSGIFVEDGDPSLGGGRKRGEFRQSDGHDIAVFQEPSSGFGPAVDEDDVRFDQFLDAGA